MSVLNANRWLVMPAIVALAACSGPSTPSAPPPAPSGTILVTTGDGRNVYLVSPGDSTVRLLPSWLRSVVTPFSARQAQDGGIIGVAGPIQGVPSGEYLLRVVSQDDGEVILEHTVGPSSGWLLPAAPPGTAWLSNIDGTRFSGIFEVQLQTGALRTVAVLGELGGRDFQVDLPRGLLHYITGGDGNANVMTLEIGRPVSEASVVELPEPCEILTNMSMAPDGSTLFVSCYAVRPEGASIKLLAVALGTAPVPSLPEPVPAQQSLVSPDGKFLVYVDDADNSLRLLRLSDGQTSFLTSEIPAPLLGDWR